MVERRTFLIGSALAAGVALLEACGDEVQYLVQPLERPEGRPGEGVWKQSVCGQCAAGCGTLMTTSLVTRTSRGGTGSEMTI